MCYCLEAHIYQKASMGDAGLPEYILQQNVTVNTPNGPESMRNPLESFVIPEDVAEGTVASARNVRIFEELIPAPA